MTARSVPFDTYQDAAIEMLVDTFYERVQGDPLLSPVFARRIDSWPPHLLRMRGFWTAVLRGEPTYQVGPKGPPPHLHRGIAELERAHFTRWLALFEEVARDVFAPAQAEHVVGRAHRMADALGRHLTV
ncbi:MAG: group III truncated hemoglobin [Sandaracinaceae bacterium]